MTLDQIQTFLEIAETGNFNRAAENLNVTQSTISARIRGLEETLGQSLFLRSHSGVSLSAAGRQFRRYALNMMRMWQQARQEVRLPETYAGTVGLGAQVSLWERLVLRWMPWMREHAPDVAIRVEADYSGSQSQQLADGILDIGVMYSPRQMSGFVIEPLLKECLILVSTDPDAPPPEENPNYVFVDWGDVFRAKHAETYPNMPPPAVSVGLGTLGLQYILKNGGSGFFPKRLIKSQLRRKKLFQLSDSPEIERPAYMVYPSQLKDREHVSQAITGLREVAAAVTEG